MPGFRLVALSVTLAGLAAGSADGAATPVSLHALTTGRVMRVKIDAVPGAPCTLTVSASGRSLAVAKFRTGRRGSTLVRWRRPKQSPSGRWLLRARCTDGLHLGNDRRTIKIRGGNGTAGFAVAGSLVVKTGPAVLGDTRPQTAAAETSVPVVSVDDEIGRGGGGGDDYPERLKKAPMDSIIDQWRMYNRECTSFVAWALASRNGFNIPFHANANAWGAQARARGFAVNSTPAPGAVAWSNLGKYGHVAYVQDVNGGQVYIEEYNRLGTGRFSSRTVAASAFTGYIHFADRAPDAGLDTSPNAPAAQGSAGGSTSDLFGGSTGGGKDLVYVKTQSPASGKIEVHYASSSSGYQSVAGDWASGFGAGEAGRGTWTMAEMDGDGRPDLVFIKTANVASGKIEVHYASGSSGYQTIAGSWASAFSGAEASRGTWTMSDMDKDGRPDLVYVKTKNGESGKIEVHYASGSSGYATLTGSWASAFSGAEDGRGTWTMSDMDGDGRPDLVYVKTKDVESGRIEVHYASGSSGYQNHAGAWASAFSSAENGGGTWTTARFQ